MADLSREHSTDLLAEIVEILELTSTVDEEASFFCSTEEDSSVFADAVVGDMDSVSEVQSAWQFGGAGC